MFDMNLIFLEFFLKSTQGYNQGFEVIICPIRNANLNIYLFLSIINQK